MSDPLDAISLENIRQAREELGEAIVRTPVLAWTGEQARPLTDVGMDVWLKLELFQQTGTFKARGALNSVRHLSDEAKRNGITAVSAGNHAVAAAFAAREMGLSAKVVMIKTANAARVERARGYGAEIIFADNGPSAFDRVDEICAAEGRAMVHPFEGPYVAQGAGHGWFRVRGAGRGPRGRHHCDRRRRPLRRLGRGDQTAIAQLQGLWGRAGRRRLDAAKF